MSFKTNKFQQITLNDSFLNLTPRNQKIIEKSWAKSFADVVFPAINEERFSVLYSSNKFSRPNTPVNIIVGALMIKDFTGISDQELLESICCDIRYQYALHTTHLDEQPVSDRTFSRFRERLLNYREETGIYLLDEEMKHLADVYSKFMDLNPYIKRMDSLMIASRCKKMSRLEILYTVTANAVRLITRLGLENLLPIELRHYLDDDDMNQIIYHCKGEDITDRLSKVIQEAVTVKEIMTDDSWFEFSEYKLLIRVINEQTHTDENGNTVAKDKSEISADSLQNPSDPDATYRRKAGKDHKGYVGNLVETVGENGDGLITDFQFEQNTHSDSAFMKEYLDSRSSDSEPEIMVTDGAYGGKDNLEKAASVNTRLVTTALSGKATDSVFAGFEFNESGDTVIKCPMGHSPEKTTYYSKTGMCRVLFSKSCCENCPNKDRCNAKEQRKNFAVHVSLNMVNRAKYLQKLSTDEYKNLTHLRNAIEGIPSVLRRRFRVDEMPVYGYERSRIQFSLKIGAYNMVKLFNHIKRKGGYCAQNLVTV